MLADRLDMPISPIVYPRRHLSFHGRQYGTIQEGSVVNTNPTRTFAIELDIWFPAGACDAVMVELFLSRLHCLLTCVFGHVRSSGGSISSALISPAVWSLPEIMAWHALLYLMPLPVVRRGYRQDTPYVCLHSIYDISYLSVRHLFSIVPYFRRQVFFFPHVRSWVDVPLSFERGRVDV